MAGKNPMGKARKVYGQKGAPERPYVVFDVPGGGWRTEVLKTYQLDGLKPYARAFCRVITPMTGALGDMGDTYTKDIPGDVIEYDETVFPSAAAAQHAVLGYAVLTF